MSLLQVEDLHKIYPTRGGLKLTAVDGVSFQIAPGETLGLVGESGSGKSTVARCVLRLEQSTSGRVVFDGVDLTRLTPKQVRPLRRQITMVFQDPYDSLNPRMVVGNQVADAILVNGMATLREARERVRKLFVKCGLKSEHMNRYPHQLSGGQQQRVSIARALATEPRLIILDEPTSSLDVSVQAKILNLLGHLQVELGLGYLFISHDLSVVSHLADRVAVMYLGQIVEIGSRDHIFDSPRHPYTMAMMSALAGNDPLEPHERIVLAGEIPSPVHLPKGCRLASRCPFAGPECATTPQHLAMVEPEHWVACHRVDLIKNQTSRPPSIRGAS